QLIRLRVVGDEHIGPAVIVVIEHGYAKRLGAHVEKPRLRRHVCEPAAPQIPEEPAGGPAISLRSAIRLLFAVQAAEDVLLRGPADVIADKKIQEAVTVVVEPHGRTAEALAAEEPGGFRDIREGPFARVSKKAA